MKAMVLAAGLGTRLRPLTDSRPKALAEIAGRTLLDITLARLRTFGITDVIINVHHLADQVVAYLKANNNFGMHIELSREDVLLDTGGGLKKAAWFLQDHEPFILHNVDVVSDIDLSKMLRFHVQQGALATLAVEDRKTSRLLLFDEKAELCGRRFAREAKDEIARTSKKLVPLAFAGIHVISPRLLPMLTEDGVFSIIPAYLRLAGNGEKIAAFRADRFYWRDLGTAESLAEAADEMKQRGLL
jgi:NDP-sugar pyrophosphorylase family protein